MEKINQKLPLSVSFITFNEESNLPRALDSIKDIASEIIVVDSHSTDKTREIAKKYGAKVYEENWKGHIAQKNSALEKCTQPWILSLDADEEVSPELKNSIIKAIKEPFADGYYLNRKTFHLGRWLNHAWQPDWKLRLVKKSANPRWSGYDPHDVLVINGKTAKLKGFLYHYSYKNIEDHFQRLIKYAKTAANSYHKQGIKFSFAKLILHSSFAFIKEYFLKRGFLDGLPGLEASIGSFFYVFLKYMFLWEIEKNKNDKKKPEKISG